MEAILKRVITGCYKVFITFLRYFLNFEISKKQTGKAIPDFCNYKCIIAN